MLGFRSLRDFGSPPRRPLKESKPRAILMTMRAVPSALAACAATRVPDPAMYQSSLSSFVRLSNPGLLALGTLCYAIGPAVTDYLGLPVDRARLVLGWLVVTAVLLVGQ